MKLSNLFLSVIAIAGISFMGSVNAADITIYYAPTCPHCHHARDFISNNLIYEYDNLRVNEVNVTNADNRQAFVDALFKCGYQKGGVPVLVIGEKCFQGYADSMQQNLRDAIEADLTQEQKNAAVANKAALESNRDAFVASHSDRKNAISEKDNQKKK